MLRLSALPEHQHPFNADRYRRLYNELDQAAAELAGAGFPELSRTAVDARQTVYTLWIEVRATERVEVEG